MKELWEETDETGRWRELHDDLRVVSAMKVKDILAELAAVPDGTFLDVAGFNEHHIGACSITGVSPVWEMHPDTDEFFYIIEGTFELTVLMETGPEHRVVPAGSTFVVPRGLWHKPAAPNGAKFLYLTPGQTLHSDAEDPRETAANPKADGRKNQ